MDREDKYTFIDRVLSDELLELEDQRARAIDESRFIRRIRLVKRAIKRLRELGGWQQYDIRLVEDPKPGLIGTKVRLERRDGYKPKG